jgi:hypothetical protein
MKKMVAISVASLALFISQSLISPHSGSASADEAGIPLPSGQFSDSAHDSVAFCVDPSTIAEEPCSTSGAAVLAVSGLDQGSGTLDSAGNACGSFTEVDSFLPLAPSSSISPTTLAKINTSPPLVVTDLHGVFQLVDYDSSTGIGHRSVTVYLGGTCNGASFDKTDAMQVNGATQQFVVSDGGNRIDFFVTQFTNPAFGSFSVYGTALRQTRENDK